MAAVKPSRHLRFERRDARRVAEGFAVPDEIFTWEVQGPDDIRRRAWLALPGGAIGSLPVVLTPHPFGFTATSTLFGEPAGPRSSVDVAGVMPAARRHRFAVLALESEGTRHTGMSLGLPSQLDSYVEALLEAEAAGAPLDRSRVAAAGLSMGGQEAILLAVAYPGIVRAAVGQNAIADLGAWHDHLDRQDFGHAHASAMRAELGGSPAENPSAWARRSPLARVADARPNLRLQLRFNDLDTIVPASSQSRELAAALTDHGVDVDQVIDLPHEPVAASDAGRAAHEYVNWDHILAWLDRQLD